MSPTQYAKLPQNIQSDLMAECAAALQKKRFTLAVKRGLDLIFALLMSVVLLPVMLVCAVCVAAGRDGPVLFRQERVGRFGKPFKIIKFRTMAHNVSGSAVTVDDDCRITRAGRLMRKLRLDELPQLFNVIRGDMSIVGPRPEVAVYVDRYEPDWRATLLVRPGVTARSSIEFADEAELMKNAENADEFYVENILPKKCGMNIDYVKNLSLSEDIKTVFATVIKIFLYKRGTYG